MRGQEQLIELRKTGRVPRTVQIFAGLDHSKAWLDWHEIGPRHAEVEIADEVQALRIALTEQAA